MTTLMAGMGWLRGDSDHNAFVTTGNPRGMVEAYVGGKRPNRPSEDVLVVTADYVAVIDGMSSPLRSGGQRASGRAYAMAVAEAITALPSRISARDAVTRISGALTELDVDHSGPAGAVAAICSLRMRELWRVGDIHVRINESSYPGSKRVDQAMAGFRAAVNQGLLLQGVSADRIRDEDPGLAAVAPLLKVQPSFANHVGPFGYGVLNGQPVPEPYVEIFPLHVGDEIALASDGYLGPRKTLSDAESELARLVRADPLSVGPLWEMGKSLADGADAPDDRTYVRIRLKENQ